MTCLTVEKSTRFTKAQYEEAIKQLQDAMTQIEPNGHCCHICHDTGHMAWECGHNPLYAMQWCKIVATRANLLHDDFHLVDKQLEEDSHRMSDGRNADVAIADQREAAHELLHLLSGYDSFLGSMYGPAKVVLP